MLSVPYPVTGNSLDPFMQVWSVWSLNPQELSPKLCVCMCVCVCLSVQNPALCARCLCGRTGRHPACLRQPGSRGHLLRVQRPNDGHFISSCPVWGWNTHLLLPKHVCPLAPRSTAVCPVHHRTRLPPRGQEVLPTSTSATRLVTCGH